MRTKVKKRTALAFCIIVPIALVAFAAMKISGSNASYSAHQPSGHRSAGSHHRRPYNALKPPKKTAYSLQLGVFKLGLLPSLAQVEEFDLATGIHTKLILLYSDWGTYFRLRLARTARKHHMELLVQMQPNDISFSSIVDGEQDAYLKKFARQVKALGAPVILGFAHEMNGDWYSWGRGHVTPSLWVKAWIHVVSVFRKQGATNVSWIWTVHHTTSGLKAYWPGAKWVNLVGVDGYFTIPGATYKKIFGQPIDAIRKFAPKTPILLAETAVSPAVGDHVARDVRELFKGAEQQKLVGLVWFDVNQAQKKQRTDWALEDSPTALAAFHAAAEAAEK